MMSFIRKNLPPSFLQKVGQYRPSFFYSKKSYSQCGEDLLISFVLNLIHGSRPKTYVDLGAHHAFYLSNTALLYEAGGRGILVEPDPFLAKYLIKNRPRDTLLQCGVHFSGDTHADFFVIDPLTLNTFSRHEMERYIAMGHKLINTLQVELMNINSILDAADKIDLLSIDIEGLDRAILEQIDWSKYRPACVCVETIAYSRYSEPKKISEISDLMFAQDYILYADTFVNSIFVDLHQWRGQWDKI